MRDIFNKFFSNMAVFLIWISIFLLTTFVLSLFFRDIIAVGEAGFVVRCLTSASIANPIANFLYEGFGLKDRLCVIDFHNGLEGFIISVFGVGFDVVVFIFKALIAISVVYVFIDLFKWIS